LFRNFTTMDLVRRILRHRLVRQILAGLFWGLILTWLLHVSLLFAVPVGIGIGIVQALLLDGAEWMALRLKKRQATKGQPQ
jgi:hypothetical protein